jgi:hypothetical protein
VKQAERQAQEVERRSKERKTRWRRLLLKQFMVSKLSKGKIDSSGTVALAQQTWQSTVHAETFMVHRPRTFSANHYAL